MSAITYPSLRIYKIFRRDIWGSIKNVLLLNNDAYKAENNSRLGLRRRYIVYNNYLIGHNDVSVRQGKMISFFFETFFSKKFVRKRKKFIYIIDSFSKPKQRKRFKKTMFSLRLLRLFYVNLSYRNFRTMAIKARKKRGSYHMNYLYLLEGRIISVFFRSGFVNTMFDSIRFIKLGYARIDKICISNPYYLVSVMLPMGVSLFIKGSIWWNIVRRLNRKAFMGFPKYMYISKRIFFFMLKRFPYKREIINPIRIDISKFILYVN
jgi:ribosomal protein S4